MAYTRKHARPVLTDAEYELFEASLGDHIGEHDAAALRTAIGRVRRLRDKARDLHRRQAGAVRTRARARGAAHTANERTAKKAAMLAEALERFEKRLEKLDAAHARAQQTGALEAKQARTGVGARPANRAERRAASTRRGGSEGSFMSASARAESTTARRAPQTRIAASRAAAGRRRQAKRDRG